MSCLSPIFLEILLLFESAFFGLEILSYLGYKNASSQTDPAVSGQQVGRDEQCSISSAR